MRKLDAELREYFESMVEGMGRTERRRALELYLTGLLLEGERKSVEPMAGRLVEEAGLRHFRQGGAAHYALARGDFNADGRSDLAALSSNASGVWTNAIDINIADSLGFDTMTVGAHTPFHMRNGGPGVYRTFSGDFNGDGRSDLATLSPDGAGGWRHWYSVELSYGYLSLNSQMWPSSTPTHIRQRTQPVRLLAHGSAEALRPGARASAARADLPAGGRRARLARGGASPGGGLLVARATCPRAVGGVRGGGARHSRGAARGRRHVPGLRPLAAGPAGGVPRLGQRLWGDRRRRVAAAGARQRRHGAQLLQALCAGRRADWLLHRRPRAGGGAAPAQGRLQCRRLPAGRRARSAGTARALRPAHPGAVGRPRAAGRRAARARLRGPAGPRQFPPGAASRAWRRHTLQEGLAGRKIAVRRFPGDAVRDYLRITVPPAPGADRLLEAFRDLLGSDAGPPSPPAAGTGGWPAASSGTRR